MINAFKVLCILYSKFTPTQLFEQIYWDSNQAWFPPTDPSSAIVLYMP